MVKKFAFWLEGIVEDTPLPDEVDIIVFKVDSNGNYKYLQMLGFEKQIDLNKVNFRPLEAEFFNVMEFFTNNEKLFQYRIKNMIDDAFGGAAIKQQFIGRKIFLYNKNVEFLFDV